MALRGLSEVIILSGLHGQRRRVNRPVYKMFTYDKESDLYPHGPLPTQPWMLGNLRGGPGTWIGGPHRPGQLPTYGSGSPTPWDEPSLGVSPLAYPPTVVSPLVPSERVHPMSQLALRPPKAGAPTPYWSLGQVGQIIQAAQSRFVAVAQPEPAQFVMHQAQQAPALYTVNAPVPQPNVVQEQAPPRAYVYVPKIHAVVSDVQRALGVPGNLREVQEGYWASGTTNAFVAALPVGMEVNVQDPVTGEFPLVQNRVKEVDLIVVEGDMETLRSVVSGGIEKQLVGDVEKQVYEGTVAFAPPPESSPSDIVPEAKLTVDTEEKEEGVAGEVVAEPIAPPVESSGWVLPVLIGVGVIGLAYVALK